MNKKVELLAPAGSWESFTAAVENGADAVYMGGRMFSARQYAENFDDNMLEKAIDYAHPRGVKIYLAVNTLMHDEELEQAVTLVKEAYAAGVDAVIVQDIGLAALLRKLFPDLKLHASTQSVIYSEEGVEEAVKRGFDRIVLARELSLKEIQKICTNTKAEIEVFVHGALCVCYSGQCLMSSIIGGRSGNRGKCAQPCRQKYTLSSGENPKGASGFLMSTKDIALIEELGDLVAAGVTSLKIEGRMKSPEYVAIVVKTYRKYLDMVLQGKKPDIDEKDREDLAQIFNRGGFSRGYLHGQGGSDMISHEKPKNWGIQIGEVVSSDRDRENVTVKLNGKLSIGDGVEIWNGEEVSPGNIVTSIKIKGRRTDTAYEGETAELGIIKGRVAAGNKVYRTSQKSLLKEARATFEGRNNRQSPVKGSFSAAEGTRAVLKVWDDEGNSAEATGEKEIEKARNKPTSRERLMEQLNKTGSTPLYFDDIEVNMEDGLMLPVSEINDLRRKALDNLERKKIDSKRRNIAEDFGKTLKGLLDFPGNSRNTSYNKKISVFFYHSDDESTFEDIGADRYYFPFESILNGSRAEKIRNLVDNGIEVYLTLPPIIKGNYSSLIDRKIKAAADLGVEGILLPNLSMLDMGFEKLGLKLMGDSYLNTFNSVTLKELKNMGLSGVCLSHELNVEEIRNMVKPEDFITEVAVYGRVPLMVSEHCPAGSFAGGKTRGIKCSNVCQKSDYFLTDKTGAKFPVSCNPIDCRSTILNNNVLFLGDSLSDVAREADMLRLMFFDEDLRSREQLVEMHRRLAMGEIKSLEDYSELMGKIKKTGFTKGHFYRGV